MTIFSTTQVVAMMMRMASTAMKVIAAKLLALEKIRASGPDFPLCFSLAGMELLRPARTVIMPAIPPVMAETAQPSNHGPKRTSPLTHHPAQRQNEEPAIGARPPFAIRITGPPAGKAGESDERDEKEPEKKRNREATVKLRELERLWEKLDRRDPEQKAADRA